MRSNILFGYCHTLIGDPLASDWPLYVQSNTPDGVAFPLPLAAFLGIRAGMMGRSFAGSKPPLASANRDKLHSAIPPFPSLTCKGYAVAAGREKRSRWACAGAPSCRERKNRHRTPCRWSRFFLRHAPNPLNVVLDCE